MKKYMYATIALMASANFLNAEVLYKDEFSRAGRIQGGGFPQVLKSSAPSVKSHNGNWWKSSWSSQNNSLYVSGSSSGMLNTPETPLPRAAFLDFSPQTGFIYTLSVEMSVKTRIAGKGFLAIGFSDNSLEMSAYQTAKDAWDDGAGKKAYSSGEYTTPLKTGWGGWKLCADNSTLTFKNPGYADSSDGGASGKGRFEVRLDTRKEQWKIEWRLNGQTVRTETYTDHPPIQNIFLSTEDLAGGTYKKFELISSLK